MTSPKNQKGDLIEYLLISSQALDTFYMDENGLWDVFERFDSWVKQVALALKSVGMDAELELWTQASENLVFEPGKTNLDLDSKNYLGDLNSMRAILTGIREKLELGERVIGELFPLSIVSETKGNIRDIAVQANGCYEKGWYDASAVMIRRLIEILIIDCFETHNIIGEIKGTDSNILPLRELVEKFLEEPNNLWHVERSAKPALKKMKEVLDAAAHGRYRKTQKQSIDRYKEALNIAIQQLVGLTARKA